MGVVIPFPLVARRANRLSTRDRIEALNWSDAARGFGISRVVIHDAEDDANPEIGDFMLLYSQDGGWARWGVGCSNGEFIVWQAASGRNFGHFPTLRSALDSLLQAAVA
ncbi:MAG TPA: hypothetical protein VGC80_01995 [Acetobacteraceae bacterium]|jgi:hypothetical protein